MHHTFFAMVSRMKYIERWSRMYKSRPENLCEHTVEVSIIAHALCVIGNVRFKKNLDANKAALIGLYHDCAEIVTGDTPTPIKYYSENIKTAFKNMEKDVENLFLSKLPDDLRPVYADIFETNEDENEVYIRRLVKAADKLSALIKCIEEEKAGDIEFKKAKESTLLIIHDMSKELEEVEVFMEEFLPAYGKTLDEL